MARVDKLIAVNCLSLFNVALCRDMHSCSAKFAKILLLPVFQNPADR